MKKSVAQGARITVINDRRGARAKGDGLLIKAALETLRTESVRNAVDMNIMLTGDKKISGLNRKFLGRNGPTDVIAFGSGKLTAPAKTVRGFIGEIAISAQTAKYNSRIYGTSPEKEVLLCVIHGVLHLLGYDDRTKKQQKAMQAKQDGILGRLCAEML